MQVQGGGKAGKFNYFLLKFHPEWDLKKSIYFGLDAKILFLHLRSHFKNQLKINQKNVKPV